MNAIQNFIKTETSSAKILLLVALLALLLSNSPWRHYYETFFKQDLLIQLDGMQIKANVSFWINEGLMAIFFLMVGLEIKYEMLQGSLNSLSKAALPAIAAVGGMVVPALIYLTLNYKNSSALRGWAIPTATDIAFALGVLSLIGSRAPSSLKTFLMALAVLDDLIAIAIIALFYTSNLSYLFLSFSLACLLALIILNISGVTRLFPYVVLGIALWIFLIKANIHPTLAGVVLAPTIPLQNKKTQREVLSTFRHRLHPWVAFGILPLFAFANAGVSLLHLSAETVDISIGLGILLGLFLGKQLGVFGISWLAIKLRFAKLPAHANWLEFYAVTILCGMGFTISLLIGDLAFGQASNLYLDSTKIGVLAGTLLSGIIGYSLLLSSGKQSRKSN